MVFILNIVDLTIAVTITSLNKSYFIYKKIYCSIKLSTIPLRMKYIRQGLQFSWFLKRATTLGKI